MPTPGRHHAAVASSLRVHQETLRLPALPIIENLLRLPAEQHYTLIAVRMPVNRHHRPRLQSIQHSLAPIRLRGTQVEILPQARIGSGLGEKIGNQGVIDFDHGYSISS